MKMVLKDNAELAWASALKYREYLLSGRDTLLNKKSFISSLHNAIELYTKQLMIRDNDYRIIEIRAKDKDAVFAKKYYSANDLNEFFTSLEKDELTKFKSIQFSDLPVKDYIKNNILFSSIDYNKALNTLNRLRNMETHFVFDDGFLSDEEFAQLDAFLLAYYEYLMQQRMLPYHFGRKSRLIDSPSNRLIPDKSEKHNAKKGFTFKNRLQDFTNVKFTRLFYEEINLSYFYSYGTDSFGIANSIYSQSERISSAYSFDDVWDYVISYLKHNLISVEEYVEENEDEIGNSYEYSSLNIKWNGRKP